MEAIEIKEIVATTSDGRIVHCGTTENICVCCGKPIPEGTEVCYECQKKYT